MSECQGCSQEYDSEAFRACGACVKTLAEQVERNQRCMSEVVGDANVYGRTLCLDLFYPRAEDRVDTVEFGLCDTRAADSIRISYDFERDGYSIKQASKFCWATDEDNDEDWQEVAFVEAWAREETEEQTEARLGERQSLSIKI